MSHELEECREEGIKESKIHTIRRHLSVEPMEEVKVECLVPVNHGIIREHFWVVGKRRKSLRRLQEYCDSLLDTLKAAGKLTVFGTCVEIREEEACFCVELRGDNREKKELFSHALMELLTPYEGRRWVVEQTGANLRLGRGVYLGVPEIFSESREEAERFGKSMGSDYEGYRVLPGGGISQTIERNNRSCLRSRVEIRSQGSE